jgi:photosystem II stability/assembly factor-like uncharacterized protein
MQVIPGAIMMRALRTAALLFSVAAATFAAKPAKEEPKKDEGPLSSATFAGLALRSIGPALTSGRIADLAVDPTDAKVWWVAAASGGVWKTTNSGTTWTPVFDGEGSYSIGAIAIDPKNPNVVWVGTGENNNQRSVAYGDGVYRTLDGGKSWKKMGLEKSEHIGRILIDPRDSRVVWVAAQGPLWSGGGERGVYKSSDFGETWTQALKISDDTGVTDVLLDPRDPDTVYAAAHQRRRHVWTLIEGGPESALHKTVDGGKTWRKLESGLPKGDIGRIGLALSPQNPDVVYAIVEAEADQGGFFRSTDRGESWEKRSPHVTSGNYYTELFADPHQFDRVYSMDTFLQVSDDGGKSFRGLGEKSKHVDNHVIWVDPKDADHYLVGCDGGLYESFDRAATWRFFENLPITQFYRVGVDNAQPFYNVCGGTQDNFSLCGPSRTARFQGPANEDWEVAQGGDGFWTVTDPTDPNIVYAEAQHGALTRFDRRSGENLDIQPQPAAGEPPLRWNWDSPLVLSPHSPTRLYFAANRLFRSDDRGDSWRAVSPDLSRQLDRNQLKVMGRIQRPEAVAKNASTSIYGNIVSLAESPLAEGLLYVGTDDGLIQVSEDGGANWRRGESFPGVPDRTYVSRLVASRHDAATVYAAFDNHKMGDFKPYVLKSGDRGRTWASIAGDLPARRRRPQRPQPPLRRHGIRPLLHSRRRQEVDSAEGRAADHPGARSRRAGARGRPRARDLRPRLLHSRRSPGAARPRCREARSRSDPLPRRQGTALRPRLAHRRSRAWLPRRNLLHRRQPALRGHLHLVPQGCSEDHEGDARRGREEGPRREARHRLPESRNAAGRNRGGGCRRRAHRRRRPGSDGATPGDQASQGDAAPDLGPALSGGRPGSQGRHHGALLRSGAGSARGSRPLPRPARTDRCRDDEAPRRGRVRGRTSRPRHPAGEGPRGGARLATQDRPPAARRARRRASGG